MSAAPRIEVVSGDGQRAVIGTRYPSRLTVKVFDDQGNPARYVRIMFRAPASGAPTVVFDDFQAMPYRVVTLTNEEGMVSSPFFAAGWGVGSGTITAELLTEDGTLVASAPFTYTNTTANGLVTLNFQDMWWAGKIENGWGLSVVQHRDVLLTVIFAYDLEGDPIWYVMPGGHWEQGLGSVFTGDLYSPTSTPFFAYDASRFAPGPPLGTLHMSFNGADTMFLDDGLGIGFFGHKRMSRLPFARESPFTNGVTTTKGVADMWWGGPSQNGWGVSILEQPGNLFAIWYTYDEDFRPIWFVLGGEWVDDKTFAGGVYRTRSSPWSGRSYDASQWGALTVGSHTLHFTDASHATLEYNVLGRSGTLVLMRQAF